MAPIFLPSMTPTLLPIFARSMDPAQRILALVIMGAIDLVLAIVLILQSRYYRIHPPPPQEVLQTARQEDPQVARQETRQEEPQAARQDVPQHSPSDYWEELTRLSTHGLPFINDMVNDLRTSNENPDEVPGDELSMAVPGMIRR